ncbi:MAG: alpha/beta hydrolase [Pseudomonadota bacterium]
MSKTINTPNEPKSYFVNLKDVTLNVTEWPGQGDPVLLLHATGFHSRCWDCIARRLDAPVFAADLRFHGGSDSHGQVNWQVMAEDIEQLLVALDLVRAIGVGHSLGGYLLALAAARSPTRFKHVILIDPVIFPKEYYVGQFPPLDAIDPATTGPSRRKRLWRDSEQMYQRFKSRAPFNRWHDKVLRDYCTYALRTIPDDSEMELACDPLHEAAVYLHQKGNEVIYDWLPRLDVPATVLRGTPDFEHPDNLSASPTWPGLADMLPKGRDIYLPHLSHFIPMESPGLVEHLICEVALTD